MNTVIKSKPMPVRASDKMHTCLSCSAEFSGNFCYECGQNNKNMRRSVWILLADIFGGLFSFETKMWKTWTSLILKPGKVARAYAFGARSRFSSPIRTYLVMSLIFFGYMALSKTNFISFELRPNQEAVVKGVEEQNTVLDDTAPAPPKNDQKPVEAMQNPEIIVKTGAVQDDEQTPVAINKISDLYSFKVRPFSRTENLYKPTEEDLKILSDLLESDDSFFTINNSSVPINTLIHAVFSNPKMFNNSFNTWLPRLLFCMVPFAALLGWVFIHGKNVLLYDHIIHALYLHTIFFLFVLISGVCASLFSGIISGGIIFLVLMWVLFLYFAISIKTTFKRSWVKTIWTSFLGGGIYVFLLFAALCGIAISSITELI